MAAIVRAPRNFRTAQKPKNLRATEAAPESPAIATIRRRKAAASLPPGLLPDTPEEHKRQGDAVAAMWRKMVRRMRQDP
jgi:hypothetical protein